MDHHYFNAENATGAEREVKRAVEDLAGRVAALEGTTEIEPTGTPGGTEGEEEGADADASELPEGFPHRAILGRRGISTREQLAGMTVEELIELEEIGEARASDIVAARDNL